MRRRQVPPPDVTRAELLEAGTTDAPHDGEHDTLAGLLDLAAHVAERKKRVTFPDFTWEDPRFVAADAKVTMELAYARFDGGFDLPGFLLMNLPRAGGPRRLLALDLHRSPLREFDVAHALYGEPSLFEFRHRPHESADPRVDDARERGWTRTLKEHNLLPGRGLVVLDEHQGLFLREHRFVELLGILVLLPDGQIHLWWNPFSRHAVDAEIQHWFSWGDGTAPASAWRELLHVEGRDEP